MSQGSGLSQSESENRPIDDNATEEVAVAGTEAQVGFAQNLQAHRWWVTTQRPVAHHLYASAPSVYHAISSYNVRGSGSNYDFLDTLISVTDAILLGSAFIICISICVTLTIAVLGIWKTL